MILPGFFTRQFDLDIDSLAIRNTVSENVGLAMLTDVNDGTVLSVELPDCVVSRHTAVQTKSCYDFVLKFSFGVQGLYHPM